jgi:hypothetical protein
MKQAKEQTQDLNMTGEFLGSLLNQDPNKEQIKPSPTDSTGQRFANGKPKMPKTDSSPTTSTTSPGETRRISFSPFKSSIRIRTRLAPIFKTS